MTKKIILFSAFIGVLFAIYLKGIPYFEEPRLWAEEGTVYLKSAFEDGYKTMLMPQLGYYAIIPSITTYVATFLPLPHIPAFTQGISLVFWLILFALILGINQREYPIRIKIPFLFSILFILLNFTEVFLNTINLQFITPIVLLICTLYNEEKLTKIQVIGLRILHIICLLNGVLGILFLPYLLYKAFILEKKYDLVAIYLLSVSIHLGMTMNYEGESNLVSRIEGNWSHIMENFHHSPLLKFFYHKKEYFILLFISSIAIYRKIKDKRKEILSTILLLLSTGGLMIFIDFTKLPSFKFYSRYLLEIYCILYLISQITFPKTKYGVSFFWILLLFISYSFYKTPIRKGEKYCKECPKWSKEYQKAFTEEGIQIHPAANGLILKINKKYLPTKP